MSNDYIKSLTGIRAIAAIMVLFHHYRPLEKEVCGSVIYNFFLELHVGVTIFFVLSGFLIAYRYYENKNLNWKSYFIKRLARIYPVYFVLTTITFIEQYRHSVNGIFETQNYILNITFLKGFFDDLKFSGIGPGWSLSVEEMFYFLAPLFFILIRWSKIVLIVLPIFLVFLGFLIVYVADNKIPYGFFKNLDFMIGYTFFGRCFEFFFGIGLAIYIKKNNFKMRFNYFTYSGVVFFVFLIYLLSVLNVNGLRIEKVSGQIINTIFLPLFAIVPIFYGLIKEKTGLRNILETQLFQVLGKSSYVFYLIHLGVFKYKLDKITDNYILKFGILYLIAILMYQFFEKPVNKYITSKFA